MYSNSYLKSFTKGLEDSKFSILSKDVVLEEFINGITEKISLCSKNNGRLFFIGNGASAAFSNHMALDWTKNGQIPAFSLSDSALITALGNDYEYKLVFVKFLEIYRL
jgi:D-sedoheptulose 7-phosphate isomerase